MDIQQSSLEFPGVIAVHIPGLVLTTPIATKEEVAKYTKLHDIRQPIPHDIIRDQRLRAESEL